MEKIIVKEPALKTRDLEASTSKLNQYEMVVFSHLRWGFVYQRPQHLISRMSKQFKVLFVEEPVPFKEEEENTFHLEKIHDNLHVFKPKVRDIAAIKEVLEPLLHNFQIKTGWFYSAAFSSLINEFEIDIVIYDCMDELSLFKGASPSLISQEKFLLARADVVFTGGKSLFESKKKYHQNVHCFPSSVDREHFNSVILDLEEPEDLREIYKPIVGYFGVIDERIDLGLLQETAKLQPQTAFVMIGPLAKINEEDLPREKNIYYLGMKSYDSLPSYLKRFDIAMMPFAINDSTTYISPTKTLEYMAAGKPIISTPIKDVERDYRHCISIVKNSREFAEAIEKHFSGHHQEFLKDYEKILCKTSWDSTAAAMQKQLYSITA